MSQSRARDVARQQNLQQISSAIITAQRDWRKWPGGECAEKWVSVRSPRIRDALTRAWLSSIPDDPNGVNVVYGLWLRTNPLSLPMIAGWYLYMVSTKNWQKDGWFVLMASTETEWWSNWITCPLGITDYVNEDSLINDALVKYWVILPTAELSNIQFCSQFIKWSRCEKIWSTCYYQMLEQLRYITVY